MAPEIAGGRLYLGSDDGYAYCLDAVRGALLWKYRPGPEDARLPANEQIASRWPVRSSVVVDGKVAYCAAGLLEGGLPCGNRRRYGQGTLEAANQPDCGRLPGRVEAARRGAGEQGPPARV